MTEIQLKNEEIQEWIASTEVGIETETEGGYALFPGGHPRMEALYYAVNSLSMLGLVRDMTAHSKWVQKFFNGGYFSFKHDTCSTLLQTCYAVEVLSLLKALPFDMNPCRKWIEAHFSDIINPKEAFFAVRALKLLDSDLRPADKWLTRNEEILSTRLDKNAESVYYYVKTMRELNREPPPSIVEQASKEVGRIREKHGGKVGL